MKKTIAIVAGGDSSEHDVSLRSAEGIYSFLDKERYEVYIIEIKGMAWEAHLKDGCGLMVLETFYHGLGTG